MVLKSLTDRIRRQFNVSVAEIDGMDLWQSSTLALAAVAGETKRVNQLLDLVLNFIHTHEDEAKRADQARQLLTDLLQRKN